MNEPVDADLKAQWERIKDPSKVMAPVAGMTNRAVNSIGDYGGYSAPLVAHAAELAVATKEFTRSRTMLEEILERHHGYAAKLRLVGQPAGSLLTATLRVPSSEFAGAVNDLKALGNVEREEQTADEITQQRADLEARLTNAQNTLARLQGMLAKGWKAGDPAQVQKQLASANAEIALLEAERVATEHRVTFAHVLFSLREQVQPPVESLGEQFRGAAVAGFSDVLGSLSAILLFAISRGPVVLLWVLMIYFPARWMWRKWRLAAGQGTGIPQGV